VISPLMQTGSFSAANECGKGTSSGQGSLKSSPANSQAVRQQTSLAHRAMSDVQVRGQIQKGSDTHQVSDAFTVQQINACDLLGFEPSMPGLEDASLPFDTDATSDVDDAMDTKAHQVTALLAPEPQDTESEHHTSGEEAEGDSLTYRLQHHGNESPESCASEAAQCASGSVMTPTNRYGAGPLRVLSAHLDSCSSAPASQTNVDQSTHVLAQEVSRQAQGSSEVSNEGDAAAVNMLTPGTQELSSLDTPSSMQAVGHQLMEESVAGEKETHHEKSASLLPPATEIPSACLVPLPRWAKTVSSVSVGPCSPQPATSGIRRTPIPQIRDEYSTYSSRRRLARKTKVMKGGSLQNTECRDVEHASPARSSAACPSCCGMRVAYTEAMSLAEHCTVTSPQVDLKGTCKLKSVTPRQKTGQTSRSFGHTLRPSQQGRIVAVIGDGWGGGEGGYDAVVTEADNHTFTVVCLSGDSPWQETHVLKKQCILLNSPAEGLSSWSPTSQSASLSPQGNCRLKDVLPSTVVEKVRVGKRRGSPIHRLASSSTKLSRRVGC